MKIGNNYFLLLITIFNIVLLSVFLISQHKAKKNTSKDSFQIPIITQVSQQDSLYQLDINYVDEVYAPAYGKYKFTDVIHLGLELENSFFDDCLPFWRDNDSTSLIEQDGLQLEADYQTIINASQSYWKDTSAYYPVYIVNECVSTKLLFGKGQQVFAIQEAKDSNGIWRPIEMKGADFCGHGKWALKIDSGEFVIFAMHKYTGTYETDLRIRLKNGESILISKAFRGKINYNQFTLKEGYWKEYGKKHPFEFKNFVFYDAYPLELSKYY